MKKIAIVGFGRFGKTLYRLLKDDFDITVFNRSEKAYRSFPFNKKVTIAKNISEIYNADVVFYAVPIRSFEKVIKEHRKYFKDKHLLIDVLSVKMHPKRILDKYLKSVKTQALLTHPMFGPDSSQDGFKGLPLVMDRFRSDQTNYDFWKVFFQKKGIKVIEISAKKHDQLAASSQGLTHFLGRLLEKFGFTRSEIDTLGAKKLHEVVEQTTNDSLELFYNLQNYNPYTRKMRVKLGKSYDYLYEKLLPKRVNKHNLVYGIQGGKGSFNEEAMLFYAENNKIKNFKIKYLFTTEKVLKNLHEGNIDYGIFAIQNAIGGVVSESTYAMARYKFRIIEEFAIKIRHFLMVRAGADFPRVTTVMAHPQVFKQCATTLKNKYSRLKLISGKGDMVDTAKAAWALSKGKLPGNTAILGPKNLARLYDLQIVDEDLQDDKKNFTSFFLVSR